MKYCYEDELNELYLSIRNKNYKDKSDWEKFLDKDKVRLSRQRKNKKKHESSLLAHHL